MAEHGHEHYGHGHESRGSMHNGDIVDGITEGMSSTLREMMPSADELRKGIGERTASNEHLHKIIDEMEKGN